MGPCKLFWCSYPLTVFYGELGTEAQINTKPRLFPNDIESKKHGFGGIPSWVWLSSPNLGYIFSSVKAQLVVGCPDGAPLKSMYSASAAQGLHVQILGADLHTVHQAMLWWRPTYKVEEDWQRMLAQGLSSSPKQTNKKTQLIMLT